MSAAQVRARPAEGPPATSARLAGRKRIGIVPIVWNNADLPDLAPLIPPETVLNEIARLGYAGTQLGIGFPRGPELARALDSRGLQLAEVYVALPCDGSGPARDAAKLGRDALEELRAAGGDVLVVALAQSPERDRWVGRASHAPRLADAGWRRLGGLLDALGAAAAERGLRLAFHNHAGTYVETPAEIARLLASTSSSHVGLCLDVGHATVGGGDPASMVARHARRIAHVHLKDVAVGPLEALREGRIIGFEAALRERIFAPLGSGILDLPSVLHALAKSGYNGWLMVEQDTSWEPPSEAAAIGRRVLEAVLRWPALELEAPS
jgi:inosose dehydratase